MEEPLLYFMDDGGFGRPGRDLRDGHREHHRLRDPEVEQLIVRLDGRHSYALHLIEQQLGTSTFVSAMPD